MTNYLFSRYSKTAAAFNAAHKRSNFVSGPDIISIFESMAVSKPATWFSTVSQDSTITIHGMYCSGWWLVVQDKKTDGIVACYGTDLGRCKCLGRAKTVEDAMEALTDLVAHSDEDAAILSASSVVEARELMRAIIENNRPT